MDGMYMKTLKTSLFRLSCSFIYPCIVYFAHVSIITTLQVIQRRDDYGDPRENFNRDWDDYKYGFGKPDQELWLGNENIFLLTKASEYEMRVDLEDFDGNKRYLFV